MENTKDIKITYHTIIRKDWLKPGKRQNNDEVQKEQEENPFYGVKDVLKYISKLSKRNKFYDMQGNKFCFLESYFEEVKSDEITLYVGFLKSARNEFRPNLINKVTGNERPNPKEITEGDIEKTHFVIKTDHSTDEVYLFLEKNFYGVSINSVINYLSAFAKQYYTQKKESTRFTLIHDEIGGNEFLTELAALTKTSFAEIYFDKKLLGSDALGFSNRHQNIKKDITLTTKATPKNSITNYVMDVYNGYKAGSISRVRVRGVDENKHEILLDTILDCKSDVVTVDKNPETGEVNTMQLYTELKKIANSF